MPKKKRKSRITIIVLVITLWTASCTAQVSDSCFSKAEINYFISQCFTASEQAVSLHIADSLLWQSSDLLTAKQGEITELNKQIKIGNDKFNNCKTDHQTDIKILQTENKELKKKNKIGKFFNYLLGIVGITASTKVGIDYLLPSK